MEIAMKIIIGLKNTTIVTVILILSSIREASAYIDPGTGSYIIQLMIAGLLGAAFTLKVYWKKVKAYFLNLFFNRTKKNKYDN